MNKPAFDPNQPYQAVDEKPPFDPSQPFQEVESAPSYGTKNIIGDVARPLLEGGGALAGGLIGAPLGPIAAAGGGALGFAAGKAGADLLDRGLGRKPLLKSVPQALRETAGDAYSGAKAEAVGLAASKIIPPVLRGMGKVRNLAGEWATGIPSKDFQSVADNPMSMVPGTLKKAGAAFDEAATNAGISSELTPEAVNRIRHPGQYAFDTFDKLKTEGMITPQEALHARQSLDAAYPVPNKKNGGYIRMLDQIRDEFQNVIANASPELKAASKDYAIAKAGSRFQALLPQNKSGTPSFVRGATMIGGVMSGHPQSLLMSPAVAGTVAAGSGAAGGALKSVLRNPAGRRLLVGGASSIFRSKPSAQPGAMNPSNGQPKQLNGTANGGYQQEGIKDLPGQITNQASPKRILGTKVAKIPTREILLDFTRKANDKASIFYKRTKTLTKNDVRRFLDMANGDRDLAKRIAKKENYSW